MPDGFLEEIFDLKILFINPFLPSGLTGNSPDRWSRRRGNFMLTLNVGMAYVASAVNRAGIDLEILDCDAHMWSLADIEQKIRPKKFDAVGIGTMVFQYRWVRDVAALVKKYHPNVPIMVGSTLSTSMPELLLRKTDVDIAVIGEADITIVELLRAIDRGESLTEVQGIYFKRDGDIVKTPCRPVIQDINSIPSPNYDLFDMEIYLENSRHSIPPPAPVGEEKVVAMPVNTAARLPLPLQLLLPRLPGDGVPAPLSREHHRRNPALEGSLRRQLHPLLGRAHLLPRRPARQLADMLIEREMNVSFFASCRSELFNWENIDVARRLQQAGCKGLAYSLENGNDEILQAMNKKNSAADFVTQSHVLREVGIKSYTSVIFGYPQETFETIDETFEVLGRSHAYALHLLSTANPFDGGV